MMFRGLVSLVELILLDEMAIFLSQERQNFLFKGHFSYLHTWTKYGGCATCRRTSLVYANMERILINSRH